MATESGREDLIVPILQLEMWRPQQLTWLTVVMELEATQGHLQVPVGKWQSRAVPMTQPSDLVGSLTGIEVLRVHARPGKVIFRLSFGGSLCTCFPRV